MGEMADFALEHSMDDLEEYWAWEEGGRDPQEGYDKGILDELGYENVDTRFPNLSAIKSKIKHSGEGPCPKCKAETILREGKFGKFYGCTNFPSCKGSRDYT